MRTAGQQVQCTSIVSLLQQVLARLLAHRLVVGRVTEAAQESVQKVPLVQQRDGLVPQTRLVSDVFQLRIAQNELRVAEFQRSRIVQELRNVFQQEVPALELLVNHVASHATLELPSFPHPIGTPRMWSTNGRYSRGSRCDSAATMSVISMS